MVFRTKIGLREAFCVVVYLIIRKTLTDVDTPFCMSPKFSNKRTVHLVESSYHNID